MKPNDKNAAQGHTKPAQDDGPVPRMPHEHDESSDSQVTPEPRAVMRQAHDDVASGRVDTDRGVPADQAYQRQKETARPARNTRAAGRKTP